MSSNSVPLITLNNGQKIPQLGFGVYCIPPAETEQCVLEALKIGYRHIDTAHMYGNEKEVGSAIKKSGIPRNEIFITSKLWVSEYGEGKTLQAIDKMLRRLDLVYIDLILLHFPFNDYMGAYKDLEKAYEQGKVKSIGISNFENQKLEELCDAAKIKPVLNQIELHPYFQQNELRQRMDKYNTKTEAWAPLGHAMTKIFDEEIIKKLAEKYKKSPAQIILRWDIQRGIITIPKSQKKERIKENFEIFDFEMTEDEIKEIDVLNGKQNRIQDKDDVLEKAIISAPAPADE
jgi:diketogulonate reductase-like aldo/keto reductase